ncbi:hypothetical protein Vafri_16085 [Volvox africanus]|uniref:Uncharacterized protein n=1 Tax=Volvox africanus TaxID=51714 RepID=A0A8J4BHJ8_9CHLO|nr:hypothetical protein Vafri_16085 [Volvox africanus]
MERSAIIAGAICGEAVLWGMWSPRVGISRNDPYGGQGWDHFRLVSEDELHIDSVIEVAGQTARYLTVYNRKPKTRRQKPSGNEATHPASSEVGDDGAGSDRGDHHGVGGAGGKK